MTPGKRGRPRKDALTSRKSWSELEWEKLEAKIEQERRSAMRFKVVDEVSGNIFAGLSDLTIEHALFTQDPPVRSASKLEVGAHSKLASGAGLLLVRTA